MGSRQDRQEIAIAENDLDGLFLKFVQSLLRGFLFRLFLASSFAFAQYLTAHGDFGDKGLCVVWTLFGDKSVNGRLTKQHLANLLQPGFIVLESEFLLSDIGRKVALHQVTRGFVTAIS